MTTSISDKLRKISNYEPSGPGEFVKVEIGDLRALTKEEVAEYVRETPLTAQPLADELHNEREVSQSLRAQLHEAAERLDEFGSQPTLADGIQAMRLRLVDLRARVAELEEFVVSWKGWRDIERVRAEKAEAERDELFQKLQWVKERMESCITFSDEVDPEDVLVKIGDLGLK